MKQEAFNPSDESGKDKPESKLKKTLKTGVSVAAAAAVVGAIVEDVNINDTAAHQYETIAEQKAVMSGLASEVLKSHLESYRSKINGIPEAYWKDEIRDLDTYITKEQEDARAIDIASKYFKTLSPDLMEGLGKDFISDDLLTYHHSREGVPFDIRIKTAGFDSPYESVPFSYDDYSPNEVKSLQRVPTVPGNTPK